MKQLPRIPSPVATVLQDTVSHSGGLSLDAIVAAAIGAFCRLDASERHWIVEDFWFNGVARLEASKVSRTQKTFKEKMYALVAGGYAALRGWFT
jgi:hypothetical protein